MSSWEHYEIQLLSGSMPMLERTVLRELLQEGDHDTPPLEAGDILLDRQWRSPQYSAAELADLIHCLGYPCRSRECSESSYEMGHRGVWKDSVPHLSPQLHEDFQHKLQFLSDISDNDSNQAMFLNRLVTLATCPDIDL